MNDVSTEAAVAAIVARAEERFQQSRQELFASTDKLFAFLMVGQWAFGVILALTVSPWAWAGKTQTVHPHVWAAVVLGALIGAMPIALAWLRPGWVVTRHVIAAAQMLWSALLIHLSGGRIETHFHVFGSLGILAAYRDWPVLVTATVVVAVEHFIRGVVWPESIYGIANPEWWRFLEHAFWVVFAVAFLGVLSKRGKREMRTLAERGAELEALAEGEWRKTSVVARAAS
jgi:hypothetical protein